MDVQPARRRKALLGIGRDYTDAIEHRLANVEEANVELARNLQSARLALSETAGWSERLPSALKDLASLAAGDIPQDDAEQTLANALLTLAGEHLIGGVQIQMGEPSGRIEAGTQFNENGRPVKTTVSLGGIVVYATWQPGIEAGPDTTGVVERLCEAVVCSLAGVDGARMERDVVTQLADERALARHLALRWRLGEPAAVVRVTVSERSAIGYRELFGQLAWSAGLADVAGMLERIAKAHGGQAYQTADRELRVLVDAAEAEQALGLIERALQDSAYSDGDSRDAGHGREDGEDSGGLVFGVELVQEQSR